jgi:glutamate synthase (NADPH/NADH) large chain
MFTFLATELREIMAELGFRTINEMVGQVDCLEMRDNITHWKHKTIDLSSILYKEPAEKGTHIYKCEPQDHGINNILDHILIDMAKPALDNKKKVYKEFKIKNTDRSTGTMLSYEISTKYKAEGLPPDTIHYKFTGSAGQSFGAFGAPGIRFDLEGEANDYFGKGLSGAKLLLYPPKEAIFDPKKNIIVGNVAFYGATSGEAYIRGQAGERFCVRNSGVKAVVEGVGDHGCEYMTGGIAVILGETGRNFAAGMSGGIAYVFNPYGSFASNCNMEMVSFDPMDDEDIFTLKKFIKNHYAYTGSDIADFILKDWDNQIKHFVKVMPDDYKNVLLKKKQQTEKGVYING